MSNLFGLIPLLLFCWLSTPLQAAQDHRPHELLIGFRGDSHQQQLAARNLSSRHRARTLQQFGRQQVEHWLLPDDLSLSETLQQLRSDKRVRFAEPNYLRRPYAAPTDPLYSKQWAINRSVTQVDASAYGFGLLAISPMSDMNIESVWALTEGSRSVVVAVIDDSIELDHPDLSANLWTNPGEIPGNGLDDDGNGYVDDIHGWDFVEQDPNTSADVRLIDGHGTAVAGIIGAVGNNALGIIGTSPRVSLMALRMGQDVAGELQAFEYAIANGADIVNASWGGPQFSFAESGGVEKLMRAGILLTAAVGNYEMNNDWVPDYPSSLPYDNILAVASSNLEGELSDWSHFGQLSVDIATPGELLLTTLAPATSQHYALEGLANQRYGTLSGTSFSSAAAAGVAALLKAQYPQADYRELRGRILASARPIDSSFAHSVTDGRVDALGAMNATPGPLLAVVALEIDDAQGNGNAEADPGELLELKIQLQNQWLASSGGSISLTSNTAQMVTNSGPLRYPALAPGASTQLSFEMVLGNFSGYRRLPFTLTIQPDEGGMQRQQLALESGQLVDGQTASATLMSSPYDEFHHYYIEVPRGTGQLLITTTAQADIDLLHKAGGIPQFDYYCYNTQYAPNIPFCRDPDTIVSASSNGKEEIRLDNPPAGLHHLVVVSFDQSANATYSISAHLYPVGELPGSAGSGYIMGSAGGGSTAPLTLVALLLLLFSGRAILKPPGCRIFR